MGIRSSPLSQFALSLERARTHRLTIDFSEKEVSVTEGIGAGNRVAYDDGMPYPAMYAFEELVAIVIDDLPVDPDGTLPLPPVLNPESFTNPEREGYEPMTRKTNQTTRKSKPTPRNK